MANLIPIQLEDGTIIHIQAQGSPTNQNSQPSERTREDLGGSQKGLREAISGVQNTLSSTIENTIRGYTQYTLNAFRKIDDVNIDKVTLEFGIQIEGNAKIPYITEGTATSNLKVTVECSFPEKSTEEEEQ
ncbi:MAG: CU044_2847 family protein [Limnothrix sp.]